MILAVRMLLLSKPLQWQQFEEAYIMKFKQTSIFQYESQTQFPVEKISGPADLLVSLL